MARRKTKMRGATTTTKEGRRPRKPSQRSPARGAPRGNGLQVRQPGVLATGLGLIRCRANADDSDDDREVSRKRTVRQAASKAVSKQREILLGDGGSEDEEQEDQEESYMDRRCSPR